MTGGTFCVCCSDDLFSDQRKCTVFAGDLPELEEALSQALQVGVGVYVELDGNGVCTTARIALGAVAPTVMRAPQAEAALVGKAIDAKSAAAAGAAASTEAKPIADQRGSDEFRRHLVEVMTTRSILTAAERAQG